MKREDLVKHISFIPETGMKTFSVEAEMFEFLKDRKALDEVVECHGYDIVSDQLENNKLIAATGGYAGDKRLIYRNELVTDDELCHVMENRMFLLSFPYRGDRTQLPVAISVEDQMYKRSKTNCAYIMQEETDARRDVLLCDERSRLVTDGFAKTKSKVHLLIRNGLVWAINDGIHVHTPELDLVESLFDSLMDFEDVELKSSLFTNDSTYVRIGITDSKSEKLLVGLLDDIGFAYETVSLGVQFTDGTRGNSASRVQPILEIDGRPIPFGNELRMEHRSDRGDKSSSIEYWRTLCGQMYSLIEDSTEQIKKFAGIKIKNPGGTLRMAAFKEKFPLEATLKVASNLEYSFPGGCTALDIYVALYDIIDVYAESISDGMTPIARLGWEEKASRFLKRDVTDIDLSAEAYLALCRS